MNSVQKFFGAGLPIRVAVYVPGTVDAVNSDAKTSERMVEAVAARLSELFGGATISLAAGAWMSAEHGLIREDVQIVYSFGAAEQVERFAGDVWALACMVRDEMRQEAVSVEIDGALYLV